MVSVNNMASVNDKVCDDSKAQGSIKNSVSIKAWDSIKNSVSSSGLVSSSNSSTNNIGNTNISIINSTSSKT
ncbi:hypothetical protein CGMCC3_g3149 [Colletotrichum fructicola]|nr:uncharacterized protein CGMCC3_g3149 [Colletotrichum fructicola]KAE9581005.1 hypothetical protein CGMCC3_g3149 [Colletotrichum fructicola]KAF4492626.1 hypothetical protein CGGC5_v001144 [Colletotrichum fructicola Nara gc5]